MAISGSDWLEVPTIYKAYFSGLNFKEYHHKIWPYMVQYLQFRILEFPLITWCPNTSLAANRKHADHGIFSAQSFALNMDRFLHCPGGHGAFPNRLGQMFHEIQMYTRIQKSVQTTLSMGISGTDWLEVPTIYFWPIFQAYVSEYPQKIWPYMVQYLRFRILKFPLTLWRGSRSLLGSLSVCLRVVGDHVLL